MSYTGNLSSPRLGVFRESMLTRPLIIKPPLGQSIRRRPTPCPDSTYRICNKPKDGGVSEVLTSWAVHSGSEDVAGPCGPDFVSLNRDAVKSGLVTSKELSQYRAQKAVTGVASPAPKQKKGGASKSLAVPDITFGVRSSEGTPMADLITHKYRQLWIDEQLSRSKTSDHAHLQKKTLSSFRDTRTSLLRKSKPLPVTEMPFKLPRFSQVAPALDTFRSQEARLRAFRAQQSGSVSRRGTLGQGTQD